MAHNYRNFVSAVAANLMLAWMCSQGLAAEEPASDHEWTRFLKERVSFSGFVENATGLSISHGSRFFNTSNRLDMQRFTIQPEFNIEMTPWAKFFISWRFVKEVRYN